jgi:hypothetical protein
MKQVDVSNKWKARFTLIEKAGGVKLTKLNQLSFSEKFTIIFNIWGLLFGPIYYLYLGLWRKAISYTLFMAVFIFGFSLFLIMWANVDKATLRMFLNGGQTGFAVLFSVLASIDYYKKTVVGDKRWW